MRIARKSLPISRSVEYLWRNPDAPDRYSAAVSLHSHTMHSREGLDFVPRVLACVPLARAALETVEQIALRRTGKRIPFERVFWRPPLHPGAAHDLEAGQIRELLGLQPLVSITDHDTLEACAELRAIGIEVPYSLEWTAPYMGTVFHIGVHNLPPGQARELESAMALVTAAPTPQRITDLLAAMSSLPDVLLVLNHPFSCEQLVERPEHIRLLRQFLNESGAWLHALELNGLQTAANNADTIGLAAERGMPVISGGDRHCLEPNANLNLTNERSFAGFVNEIRAGHSTVLFLPQYRDPISARYVEFVWETVRTYAEFTGRERWLDRVFVRLESGETVTCASVWPHGRPPVIPSFISLVGFLASPWMRAMHCKAVGPTPSLEPEAL